MRLRQPPLAPTIVVDAIEAAARVDAIGVTATTLDPRERAPIPSPRPGEPARPVAVSVRVALDAAELTVSRSATRIPGAGLSIADKRVARGSHLRIIADGASHRLEVLGSSWGAYLNGVRAPSEPRPLLRAGDWFYLVPHEIRVTYESG